MHRHGLQFTCPAAAGTRRQSPPTRRCCGRTSGRRFSAGLDGRGVSRRPTSRAAGGVLPEPPGRLNSCSFAVPHAPSARHGQRVRTLTPARRAVFRDGNGNPPWTSALERARVTLWQDQHPAACNAPAPRRCPAGSGSVPASIPPGNAWPTQFALYHRMPPAPTARHCRSTPAELRQADGLPPGARAGSPLIRQPAGRGRAWCCRSSCRQGPVPAVARPAELPDAAGDRRAPGWSWAQQPAAGTRARRHMCAVTASCAPATAPRTWPAAGDLAPATSSTASSPSTRRIPPGRGRHRRRTDQGDGPGR